MGSWVTYGLGSENENLPGFVVLISSGVQPSAGPSAWGSGFLPSVFQGIQCRSKGDPVLYVSDPPGIDRGMRRQTLDALRDLNQLQEQELGDDTIRDFVVDTRSEKDDPVLEQPAVDVIRPFFAAALLDDVRHGGHRHGLRFSSADGGPPSD